MVHSALDYNFHPLGVIHLILRSGRLISISFLMHVVSIGINETFERFEDSFNQSSIGRAVSTVNDRNTKSSLSFQEAYLRDFCTYHMSSVGNQLFRVIFNIKI